MSDSANLATERPTFVTHLECSMTGERYEPDRLHGLSTAGFPLLVRYDLEAASRVLDRDALSQRAGDFWRYRELLPIRNVHNIVSLGEVITPLVALTYLHHGQVLVKDEGRLPTGSFKARGLAVAVSMAKELGVREVAIPTNGNAGAALAAYGSRAGMKVTAYCPADTPEVNVAEIALQGATVYLVDGLINDCGKLVAQGARESGWFDFSTLKEPYRIEGKKTMGLELAEQLDWELPDAIFYPTGGGTGLIGMWKAFEELETPGLDRRQTPPHVRGTGCRLCADRSRVRARPGARRALGQRTHDCRGHSCPGSDRGFSDPACGARFRRQRDRGER